MAEVKALFKIKKVPLKEKINEELFWYDDVKKEMLTFHGGKLSFEYREDEHLVKMSSEEKKQKRITSNYRMMPKIDDIEVGNYFKMIEVSNQKDIEKWFDSYSNYTEAYVERVDREGIVFDVPNEEVDDFYYQLERQGFNY